MVHLQQGQSPSSQMKFMLDFGFSRVIQTDGARVFTEGRTTEADARSTWELLNLMPSKPALPAEGGEIEQGHKQQEDKEREQAGPSEVEIPANFPITLSSWSYKPSLAEDME